VEEQFAKDSVDDLNEMITNNDDFTAIYTELQIAFLYEVVADKDKFIQALINKKSGGGYLNDPYYMKYMKYKTKYLVKSNKTRDVVKKIFIN